MGFWNRLFGKKSASPVPPGTFNPRVIAQRPSATKPSQPPQIPPKPQPTPSQAITTMLKVCSNRRYRLLSLEEDPSFNQAIEELKREGTKGAQALAGLIEELLAARCAEIQDVLAAASRLSSQPELVNAVQKVISAPPVIAGQQGRFPPVIVGGGRLGWDDAGAARIKKQASEVLASFSATPEGAAKAPSQQPPVTPERQPSLDPQAISVACTKCNRQYHLGVDAAVVSDDGVGEDFAVVIGSYKGGGPDSPDLVAPLAAGRTPTQDTLKEVARLQRVRTAGAARYWQCNLCKTVFPYPWVRR
jgi:hypothetical protein